MTDQLYVDYLNSFQDGFEICPQHKSNKKVALLYTGGTIGMTRKDGGTLYPDSEYLKNRLMSIEDFRDSSMPAITLYSANTLLDSSYMNDVQWIGIAKKIKSLYNDFDAFVVIYGTDTMAYAASALSFILDKLTKPIIFTGSMLPMCMPINDAQKNLITAVHLASTVRIKEVCVLMGNSLLRGNRTVKVDASGLDAFQSPNIAPLAIIGTSIRYNTDVFPFGTRDTNRKKRKDTSDDLEVAEAFSNDIIAVKVTPGFKIETLNTLIEYTSGLRGIILELFGSGNMYIDERVLMTLNHGIRDKNLVVVAVSQCKVGRVELESYGAGKQLSDIGVISGKDMTLEAVYTKLGYLLGKYGDDLPTVKKLMSENLRGELTDLNDKEDNKIQAPEYEIGMTEYQEMAEAANAPLSPDFSQTILESDPVGAQVSVVV